MARGRMAEPERISSKPRAAALPGPSRRVVPFGALLIPELPSCSACPGRGSRFYARAQTAWARSFSDASGGLTVTVCNPGRCQTSVALRLPITETSHGHDSILI